MAAPASESKESTTDHAASFHHLQQHGYVVIPNVLSPAECTATIDAMWQWLSAISDGTIQRNRPSTWAEPTAALPNGKWPFSFREKGIIQWYRAGHQQFVWDIRQHPAVAAIFAQLWQCRPDELLVSYDAINIQRPIEWMASTGVTAHTDRYNEHWHHIDQSGGVRGRVCVQSFINLNDSDTDDGCLIVRPNSHTLHDTMCDTHHVSTDPLQWIRLRDNQRQWYSERGCEPLRVVAPRGSLVMWDSRTVHTAGTAQPGRLNSGQFRYVVYLCYLPRQLASEAELAHKRRLFMKARMTSHWPIGHIKVFEEEPPLPKQLLPLYEPTLQRAKAVFQPPKLTALGRRLAGMD